MTLTRAIAARLLRWFPGTGVTRYRPRLRERDLLEALATNRGSPSTTELAQARAAWRCGEFDAARESIVQHFRQRQVPAFFTDSMVLRRLASAMPTSHPVWRNRTLTRVAADRGQGLPIYATTGPVLRPGFPWATLPRGPGGDILYAVRPHRFAFAPRFALAVLYGGLPAANFAEILEDWMAFVARGESELPYVSTLVVIQRLLALSWALAFIAATPESNAANGVRAELDILRILHADISFLVPRLGSSYPNNHLLADRFAGWYVRLLFPELVPGPGNLEEYETAWLAELERQVYLDGTSFEHSLHYHELACEMAVAYVLLCRRNARAIPGPTLEQIERMLDFQVALAGPQCVTVPFGDATEDPLFALDVGEGWTTAGLRELYRALFRPDLARAQAAAPSVERAFWLLGGDLAPAPTSPSSESSPRAWRDGGYYVFPESAPEVRLVFRTGPREGRELMAGHMHSDLLSVCMNLGKQPVMVDAGTWSYRLRAEPVATGRRYLMGPAAHNGLSIEGLDPLARPEQDFRGRTSPIRVRTQRQLLGEGIAWVEAEVVGDSPYAGYRRGVVHVRGEYWLIYDRFPAATQAGTGRLGFQFSPTVRVKGEAAGMQRIEVAGGSLGIAAAPGLGEPEVLCGQFDPPGGWVSPHYGGRVAAPQLIYRIDRGVVLSAFMLAIGERAGGGVETEVLETGVALRITHAETRDLLLLATSPDSPQVQSGGVLSHADLLWLHCTKGHLRRLWCLGLRRLELPMYGLTVDALEPLCEVEISVAGQEIEVYRCEPRMVSITRTGRMRE